MQPRRIDGLLSHQTKQGQNKPLLSSSPSKLRVCFALSGDKEQDKKRILLAQEFKKQNHDVVLISLSKTFDKSIKEAANDCLQQSIFNLFTLDSSMLQDFWPCQSVVRSFNLYQYLKFESFDMVFAPLGNGCTYHSLLAKRQGVALQSTAFVIDLTDPSINPDAELFGDIDKLAANFMESHCLELSDIALSFSAQIEKHLCDLGWSIAIPCLKNSEITAERICTLYYDLKEKFIDYCQPSKEFPLVSICLTHYNRPRYLKQAVSSILAQNYPRIELVITDDGSTDSKALALLNKIEPLMENKGWQLVRQKNSYLGAARNNGASCARGEYILFMDEDNFADPDEVSTFVAIAEKTNADILTCTAKYFEGDEPPDTSRAPLAWWPYLGGAISIGAYHNYFGDANGFVRKKVFHEIGGFTEDYGTTCEDWEFYARASMLGYKIETIPEALFWYRTSSNSMLNTTNQMGNELRTMRPYLYSSPSFLHRALLLARGLKLRNEEVEKKLESEKQKLENLQNRLETIKQQKKQEAYEAARSRLHKLWRS